MTPQEMLETTKLNWTVRSEEMTTKSGLIVPDKIALIREDNNTILGVHGDGYNPYQNLELMELLHTISQSTGLALHSSGVFDDGGKVYIQLKSDNLTLGEDRIEGFVSGINSFDGSTSLAFGNANLTISCKNSFWKGYKQLNSKFRHSASMRVRVDEVLRGIDKLLKEEKETFDTIVRMSETKITPTMIDLVKKKLFQLESEDHVLKLDDISTRKQNQLIRFDMDMDMELKQKGDNVWGLFSGVTRYTTHSATKDEDRNQQNKMFGKVGQTERQLFHEISMW